MLCESTKINRHSNLKLHYLDKLTLEQKSGCCIRIFCYLVLKVCALLEWLKREFFVNESASFMWTD